MRTTIDGLMPMMSPGPMRAKSLWISSRVQRDVDRHGRAFLDGRRAAAEVSDSVMRVPMPRRSQELNVYRATVVSMARQSSSWRDTTCMVPCSAGFAATSVSCSSHASVALLATRSGRVQAQVADVHDHEARFGHRDPCRRRAAARTCSPNRRSCTAAPPLLNVLKTAPNSIVDAGLQREAALAMHVAQLVRDRPSGRSRRTA